MKPSKDFPDVLIAAVIIGLMLLFIYFVGAGIPEKASVTGISQNVPVQIGYNPSTNYWILSATIGWTKDTLYLMKLDTSTQSTISGTSTAVKTRRSNTIIIDPIGSYEQAPLTREDLAFCTSPWTSGCGGSVPYGIGAGRSAAYKVESGAWLTNTLYDIDINGQTKHIEVGMNSPAQVDLGNNFFAQNLGILPNGANFPGGDWLYIFNPDNGNYELYNRIDVQNAISYWNSKGGSLWSSGNYNTMWQWLKSQNRLPSKPVLTATNVDAITQDGDYKYIKLTYPRTAQSSVVAIYIPSTAADTITVVIGGSKAVIVGTPSITTVPSGQTARLSVTLKNTGGDDYISAKPTSSYYSFTAVGDNTKFLRNGEQALFQFDARALFQNQNCNNCAEINILGDGSDPGSGDSNKVIYGTILGAQSTVTPGATDIQPWSAYTRTGNDLKWYETPQAILLLFLVIALISVSYMKYKERR